jgi:hypothetical protein
LDLDATRVVIDASDFPCTPATDLDELESVVQSMRINPLVVTEAPATTG